MAGTREFREDDIEQLVSLRARCFEHSAQPTARAMASYFAEILLHSPWRDPDLPSLVHEDGSGKIVGFLGVMSRRMRLKKERLRVAVGTQFMVDPENRGLAGLSLLKSFQDGPQDLALADSASDLVRRIWERIGGKVCPLFSLSWTRPIRPLRHVISELGNAPQVRAFKLACRPLASVIDAVAARTAARFRPPRPKTTGNTLGVRELVEGMELLASERRLVPEYDEAELAFVFRQLEERPGFRALEGSLIKDSDGSVAGWHLSLIRQREIHVVQLAARKDKHGVVLDDLFARAWKRGAIKVTGRLEPVLLKPLAERACSFGHSGPWTLVASRRPDVLSAIERGEAILSCLEGEWWLNF